MEASDLRLEGYDGALRAHNIPVDPSLVAGREVALGGRAARAADASLRDRRNRKRKLALQKQSLILNRNHAGPPPLRYMKTTQHRASSAQKGGIFARR